MTSRTLLERLVACLDFVVSLLVTHLLQLVRQLKRGFGFELSEVRVDWMKEQREITVTPLTPPPMFKGQHSNIKRDESALTAFIRRGNLYLRYNSKLWIVEEGAMLPAQCSVMYVFLFVSIFQGIDSHVFLSLAENIVSVDLKLSTESMRPAGMTSISLLNTQF